MLPTFTQERAAIVAVLAEFGETHQLAPSWSVDRFDDILRLEARDGTHNATFCLEFKTGFWDAYAHADGLDQDAVRSGLRLQAAHRYDPQCHGQFAQCITATAKTVHPD